MEEKTRSLSLKIAEYKKAVNNPNDIKNLEWYKEGVYNEFNLGISHLVYAKYGNVLYLMGLDTTWEYTFFDNDTSLRTKNLSFSIIYTQDDSGDSDYAPLIQFVIVPKKNRIPDDAFLKQVFASIDKCLDKYLRETYDRWVMHMTSYYYGLAGHFDDCLREEFLENPMDNPEDYFLSHKIVVIDID